MQRLITVIAFSICLIFLGAAKIVLSPATVPQISDVHSWSIKPATNIAAPGVVFKTTSDPLDRISKTWECSTFAPSNSQPIFGMMYGPTLVSGKLNKTLSVTPVSW